MGQIARQFSTPMPNAFPSETMVNPAVECYAINIRSGEALQDNKQEGLNKKDVKDTPTKPTKEEMVMNAIQYPKEDEEDWYMTIDVIEELNREVHREDAMQKFQAKQGRTTLGKLQQQSPRICVDQQPQAPRIKPRRVIARKPFPSYIKELFRQVDRIK
ncbi:hypothetical protein PIB30_100814 [Stylosanthes scabra]|uniref:Uncharacterized protein n=1 Tax=Stylosanthes scabra TaxID=79078 RepID=A0ABU6TWT7_9FABA|nr:hypothetical protein [Stylosanthes scabra]